MQKKRLQQSTAGLCLLAFPKSPAEHYWTISNATAAAEHGAANGIRGAMSPALLSACEVVLMQNTLILMMVLMIMMMLMMLQRERQHK